MKKPTVRFYALQGTPVVGYPVFLKTIDHPDTENVSNNPDRMVRTSVVQAVNEDGSFETLNTLYVPAFPPEG